MSKSEVKFQKLNDDAKILGIGGLFRSVGNKSWAINLDFNGNTSQSLQFSNIPVLARKRVLNATKPYDLAGLPFSFTISNAQQWSVANATDCPAYQAHRHGKDSNQLCFVVQLSDVRVYIPQLEMARVLFYHDPFLARLSLQHNALMEDFFLSKNDNGQPVVTVREGAEYPITYFNQDDNRRFLTWVLLDSAARASFESISTNLVKNQYQKNKYQYWNFQFTPPPLDGVDIGLRGWEDRESKSFFVWEIISLNGLPSEVTGEIDFFHPGYERQVGGKPTVGDGKQAQAPDQYELDDDELSDTDKATMGLASERVKISFNTPFITNRVSRRIKSVSNVFGVDETEVLDSRLSTNEKEDSGELPGGAWNNIDDETDDAHLYLGKFQSFINMVDVLELVHGYEILSREIIKLPRVGEGKKHWLSDTQNPRCMAVVNLRHTNQNITLFEIDTSDNAAKLSTMMIKGANKDVWISQNLNQVMIEIMKKSLGWPTALFKTAFTKDGFAGIPHPKSKNPGFLPPEEISPWAQRFANWASRS